MGFWDNVWGGTPGETVGGTLTPMDSASASYNQGSIYDYFLGNLARSPANPHYQMGATPSLYPPTRSVAPVVGNLGNLLSGNSLIMIVVLAGAAILLLRHK